MDEGDFDGGGGDGRYEYYRWGRGGGFGRTGDLCDFAADCDDFDLWAGVAATIGVVIAGVMYLTAKDSPDKVAAAKKRLIEVVLGLVAWAMMAAVLNWLIPGGVNLNSESWGQESAEETTESEEAEESEETTDPGE